MENLTLPESEVQNYLNNHITPPLAMCFEDNMKVVSWSNRGYAVEASKFINHSKNN
jgi:hypothetical protein